MHAVLASRRSVLYFFFECCAGTFYCCSRPFCIRAGIHAVVIAILALQTMSRPFTSAMVQIGRLRPGLHPPHYWANKWAVVVDAMVVSQCAKKRAVAIVTVFCNFAFSVFGFVSYGCSFIFRLSWLQLHLRLAQLCSGVCGCNCILFSAVKAYHFFEIPMIEAHCTRRRGLSLRWLIGCHWVRASIQFVSTIVVDK